MKADTDALLGPAGLARARELDAEDPSRRALFAVPPGIAYLAGNSLGLQPHAARAEVEAVMAAWGELGVEAWLEGPEAWVGYAETLSEPAARVVGARASEVVAMGTLTVNLHLLLAAFYRPTRERYRILVEEHSFPSDRYAVASQVARHGFDPSDALVRLEPRPGERALRDSDVLAAIERDGASVAVVLLAGVDYLTGMLADVPRITAAARAAGCVVGWDLAHAAGNVPLALHDWDADFAAWCTYKYLNGGPGAAAAIYVHERHHALPHLAGWWGNDPATRFEMARAFRPAAGAAGWQISTPTLLSMAPVRASLRIFDEAGIDALCERSVRLTAFLERLLDAVAVRRRIEQITPRDPALRGAQISIAVDDAPAVAARMRASHGVVCDERRPDVVRLAPAPLYNTYEDCRRAAAALDAELPPR